MEQILDALVDELAKRVLKKMGEDTEKMRDFFKVRIKAEDVEGLSDWIENAIDEQMDNLKGDCVSAAEDAAKELIDSIEVEIESSATVNSGR